MDRETYQLHARVCQALSNPKRLEILNLLRKGEKSVGELVSLSQIRQANLSQHLALLRQNGIVTARKEGVTIYYRLTDPKIIQACDLLREVLVEQLARNEALLKRMRK